MQHIASANISLDDLYDDLNSQYVQVLDMLADHPNAEEGLVQLKQIHASFSSALRQGGGLSSVPDRINTAEAEAKTSEGEVYALEAEVERARAQLLAVNADISVTKAALDAPRSAVPLTTTTAAPDDQQPQVPPLVVAESDFPERPKAAFLPFAVQLSELDAHLNLSRTIFLGILSKSVQDIREDRICAADVAFAEPAAWRLKERYLTKILNEVKLKAVYLRYPIPDCVAEEERLLGEVQELATKAAEHINRGVELRRTRDDRLKTFFSECDRLTLWCRQQLINLDAMREPMHIQEYCATLVENYAIMSKNFTILLRGVEEYVQANYVPVRRALLEVSELWFYLQVSALERLARTLFEIHPESPLENELVKYAGYPDQLDAFLRTLQTYLHNDASQSSSNSKALLVECEDLGPQLATVSGLSNEIIDLAARMRVDRSAYQCLREAVLSRLTYITPSADVVMRSKYRQEELESCVRELKSWASATARGESWRDIYSKIVEIKQMIQKERDTLKE